ncbi:MAG TPA: efflux RND transporter permease subunit, partial [Longimicrobiales bacterium]|nr:efflux RND transporter permease subunit [Longimicrobiales bacterium]
MKFFDNLIRQRRFVYLAVILLSIAGIAAGLRMPASIYPELKFERISIVAEGTALAARQQMFTVTRPIEQAVSVVPGLQRMRTRSIRGASELDLQFAPGTDMIVALQLVQARINESLGDLPEGVNIQAERMLPSLFPIITYNVEGADPAQLYDIALYQIRPALASVPGVGRIEVQGSEVRQIEVVAEPARLATLNISYTELAEAIQKSLGVQAIGRVDKQYRQYLVLRELEAHTLPDIENVIVRGAVRVRDVATVSMGTEDRVRLIRGDRKPAALINISRQPGANTIEVADSVAGVMREVMHNLPAGVHIKPVYDQAELVRDAVKSVRDAMIIGALLAIIVLFAFLRHAPITAISASTIPLTMAITVFIMKAVGATFNLMSLGGMAIAIGLVIDDAVVVTENIARHLALASTRTQAIRDALSELVWPVTTSTLTTVVVFLPLGLLSGVVGQFFKALSLTLVVAVLVSLVLALTIVPLLAQQYVHVEKEEKAPSGLLGRVTRGLDSLSDYYSRLLDRVILKPRRLAIVALGLIVAAFLLSRIVGTGFLPVMDEGAFVLDYVTPTGTSLTETDRQLSIVEGILLEAPEITGITRRTGAEMGLFATEQNTGDIVGRLKSNRDRSIFEVMDDLRGKIEAALPGLEIEFIQLLTDLINDLAGNPNPVEIKLFGADLDALQEYAEQLAEPIEKVDGIVDLYNGVPDPAPEMIMRINGAAAGQIGLTPEDVSTQAQAAMLGAPAGELLTDERSVPIRVRAPDAVRYQASQLASIPILGTSGEPTPLGTLAVFKDSASAAELIRENQEQMLAVTAGAEERSLGAVMNDIKAIIAKKPPPKGIRVELGGQYESQQKAFRSMLLVITLAFMCVIAVMLVQFESFVEPIAIVIAAPLSFVGAFLLLFITRTPMNVSSMMGLTLLVGLIV